MKQIIIDLLEFSRVGRELGTLEELDLNQLIGNVVKPIRKRITEIGGNVELGLMPKIYLYETPILQIFQNLVGNSFKYKRKDVPPIIRIEGEELASECLFSISDTGIGISP